MAKLRLNPFWSLPPTQTFLMPLSNHIKNVKKKKGLTYGWPVLVIAAHPNTPCAFK